jgi:hypothetical protein
VVNGGKIMSLISVTGRNRPNTGNDDDDDDDDDDEILDAQRRDGAKYT